MRDDQFDADLFADWLYAGVFQADQIDLGYIPLERSKLAEMATTMTPAKLLALAVYPRDACAGVAMRELLARFERWHDDQHPATVEIDEETEANERELA